MCPLWRHPPQLSHLCQFRLYHQPYHTLLVLTYQFSNLVDISCLISNVLASQPSHQVVFCYAGGIICYAGGIILTDHQPCQPIVDILGKSSCSSPTEKSLPLAYVLLSVDIYPVCILVTTSMTPCLQTPSIMHQTTYAFWLTSTSQSESISINATTCFLLHLTSSPFNGFAKVEISSLHTLHFSVLIAHYAYSC